MKAHAIARKGKTGPHRALCFCECVCGWRAEHRDGGELKALFATHSATARPHRSPSRAKRSTRRAFVAGS